MTFELLGWHDSITYDGINILMIHVSSILYMCTLCLITAGVLDWLNFTVLVINHIHLGSLESSTS